MEHILDYRSRFGWTLIVKVWYAFSIFIVTILGCRMRRMDKNRDGPNQFFLLVFLDLNEPSGSDLCCFLGSSADKGVFSSSMAVLSSN